VNAHTQQKVTVYRIHLFEGDQPMKKDYLVKMSKELHAKLKAISALKGITMMNFIIEAIEEKIQREWK